MDLVKVLLRGVRIMLQSGWEPLAKAKEVVKGQPSLSRGAPSYVREKAPQGQSLTSEPEVL